MILFLVLDENSSGGVMDVCGVVALCVCVCECVQADSDGSVFAFRCRGAGPS